MVVRTAAECFPLKTNQSITIRIARLTGLASAYLLFEWVVKVQWRIAILEKATVRGPVGFSN